MYSKTGRELEEGAAPSRRLKRNLADLYGTGQVPGERLQSVIDDVAACEEQGNLQGFSSLKSSGSTSKNLARDLKRRLMKGSIWPAPYEAAISIYDPKLEREAMMKNWPLYNLGMYSKSSNE